MKSYLLIFLSCSSVLLTSAVAAQTSPVVNSITIEGNSVFTTREILNWLPVRENDKYSEKSIENGLTSIVGKYRMMGYLSAYWNAIKTEYSGDSSLVDILLSVNEGKQSIIGSIRIVGAEKFSEDDILDGFFHKTGEPIDVALLERDMDELLKKYERIGYPFANCQIGMMEEDTVAERIHLNIELRLEEGALAVVNEIRVEGNTETDEIVVSREASLRQGEIFSPAKMDLFRRRLQRLNIFAEVSEPEFYLRENTGGLLVRVREGSTNTFDGVIGYLPSNTPDQSGFFTGLASISMRNLFGTGRKVSLRWQKDDRFSQELSVRYLEPWIFGFPANLGGGFSQRQQDTSYVRRVLDLKGDMMIVESLTLGLLFSTEQTVPSANRLTSNVFRSSTYLIGADIDYDTRDDLVNPSEGVRYRTDYHYGRKRIDLTSTTLQVQIPADVSVQKLGLDLEFFVTTFKRQVAAFGVHGRELRSAHPEDGEMFRLGGMNTLRGYREKQFIGTRVVWSNVEYRFILDRRSFLYGFIDSGYYLRPADEFRSITKTEAFKYGYGIGVQLETGLGNLGVSFALGENDTFSTGKIHFGLINEF